MAKLSSNALGTSWSIDAKSLESNHNFYRSPELSNNKFSSPNLHVSWWSMRNRKFWIRFFRVWHFYPNGGILGIQETTQRVQVWLKDNIWSEHQSISIAALILSVWIWRKTLYTSRPDIKQKYLLLHKKHTDIENDRLKSPRIISCIHLPLNGSGTYSACQTQCWRTNSEGGGMSLGFISAKVTAWCFLASDWSQSNGHWSAICHGCEVYNGKGHWTRYSHWARGLYLVVGGARAPQ